MLQFQSHKITILQMLQIHIHNSSKFWNFSESSKCFYVWWIINDFSFVAPQRLMVFTQWDKNLKLFFNFLTQPWYPYLSEAVGRDVIRNCLWIKIKLAVIIIQKMTRLRANHVISNSFCINVIFSTLFTSKSTVYLRRE